MLRYADVVIPSGPDRAFTYLVPEDLQASIAVGCRVLVPFGRKYATGLVVRTPETTPLTSLKPVADVLDVGPSFSPALLALCRWIAEYYMAPLNEVVRTALPHGFGGTSKRRVRAIVTADDPRLMELKTRAPRRFTLVRHLCEHGPALITDLKRLGGTASIHSLVNALERDGIVMSEEVLPRPKDHARQRDFIDLTRINPELLQQTIDGLPARRAKARELLEAVRRMHDQELKETDLLDLLKQTGASTGLCAPFKRSGLLYIVRRSVSRTQEYGTEQRTLDITLNPQQQLVLERITAAMAGGSAETFLLHGVTGSGKTQVYIECIRHCLAAGKSAIVLVPEISLTPQIVRRFKSHFGDRAQVVHSRMSPGERGDVWRVARSGSCRIVIGPRSALFAPLQDVGLIVVDEEHEASYKQFDAIPRYHARDVAIMRGKQGKAVVLLGSATPSLESYANAQSGKFTLLELPERADNAVLPTVRLVDMTEERRHAYQQLKTSLPPDERSSLRHFQQSSLSRVLREHIAARIEKKEGVILLQNRRGFAPYVSCPDCGYVAMCDDCQVSLTYHLAKRHLRCHYCGHVRPPLTTCPTCGSAEVAMHGVGTQRVEEELALTFPGVRVLRMDLDTTTRRGAHDRILRKFGEGEADILLGTQMVAKGLDFPHVTLVGVISADTQMLLPDFRASERTFQLLTQVAGRAGRSHLRGEVIIQTAQPDHRTLTHIIDHNFRTFFEEELASRAELQYPPFSRLTLIETKGESEEEVRQAAEHLAATLKHTPGPFELLGPAPAVIGKIQRLFRWHVILRTPKNADPTGGVTRSRLQAALAGATGAARKVQIIVDVDPVGMM
jgi:primosomal protein N' (replication factor Y) (superfamily II helicase)